MEFVQSTLQEANTVKINYNVCNIIIVGNKNDSCLSELKWLPKSAIVLGTGESLEELESNNVIFSSANVIFNASGTSAILKPIIDRTPNLIWLHSIFAGLDHMLYPELVENDQIVVTNAKGIFSSSLAEYVMGACSYFSKDL